MTYYAIIFDRIIRPEPDTTDYVGFHEALVQAEGIRKWSHFLHSLYLIGTDWSARALSEHFTQTAEAHRLPIAHVVLEVNLRSRCGWLPKEAWEWIDTEASTPPESAPLRTLTHRPIP